MPSMSPMRRQMERLRREHPEYGQVELEFYWARNVEAGKKKRTNEGGPSTVLKVESDTDSWDWIKIDEK